MLFPISIFFSLLCFLALVDAAVISTRNQEVPTSGVLGDAKHGQCKELLQRREWQVRTLADTEKKSYIDAVKCLMERPAQKPVFPEAQSRFDEFQAYHMYIAEKVHTVGQFLPWHRHYLRRYELALQSECGYKGAAPYWDWAQDSDDGAGLHTSPIWDPKTGFGGDGVPGTYSLPADANFTANRIFPNSFVGCVKDGPFANHILRLGPGQLRTTHCLVRGLNETDKLYLNSKAVARTQSQPTFEQFRIELEGEPITTDHRQHDGGHDMIGGDMSNFYSSPGEPLFYLHHANLDRIWWQWQQMLPSRLYEISGRSTTTPPFKNVTLDFILQMDNLAPSIPIRDVMDIHSAPNCYTYV